MIDLTSLSEAMRAAGLGAYVVGGDWLSWDWPDAWSGKGDHPHLAFALRDAVRKIAPGSYCKPYWHSKTGAATQLVHVVGQNGRNPDGYWRGAQEGATETEAWGNALIKLNEAGLLKGGEGQ